VSQEVYSGEVPLFEAAISYEMVDLVQDGACNEVGGFKFRCGVIHDCSLGDCNFVSSEAYGHGSLKIGLCGTMVGHLEVGDDNFFWVLDGIDALVA
jgi:hypothetical protein